MIISSRKLVVKKASIEDIIAKVDAMTSEQRDAYINNAVSQMGADGVITLVKNALARTTSAAGPMYEGLRNTEESQVPMAVKTNSPSQFKQKIENDGDWSYLLVILLMLGTAGASDLGASWGQIIRGFAVTIGAGFLIWVIKRVKAAMKKSSLEPNQSQNR